MENNKLQPNLWVKLYAQQLYAFACARLSDKTVAEDLVQETFLSALKSVNTFRLEVSERNWLYAILKNKIIDHYRKTAKQSFTDLTALTERIETYFEDDGHWKESQRPDKWQVVQLERIETAEFQAIFEQCKQKLNELQNAVVSLKFLEEKESDEICKELEISASNYWVILHRAKLQLRKCLEKNWFAA